MMNVEITWHCNHPQALMDGVAALLTCGYRKVNTVQYGTKFNTVNTPYTPTIYFYVPPKPGDVEICKVVEVAYEDYDSAVESISDFLEERFNSEDKE